AAWPGICGSGVLWFGLYMITLNWGEREVDAGTAAMVVTIGPILIALLAGWLLREGFPRRLGAGMAVSLAWFGLGERHPERPLPGPVPDHAGLHHLGLRARADAFGQDGRYHIRGSRPRRPHVVAHPRPGAPVAHHRWRSAVPGRSRGNPLPACPAG